MWSKKALWDVYNLSLLYAKNGIFYKKYYLTHYILTSMYIVWSVVEKKIKLVESDNLP